MYLKWFCINNLVPSKDMVLQEGDTPDINIRYDCSRDFINIHVNYKRHPYLTVLRDPLDIHV